MTKHPPQPVELVDGVARFKANPIVRYLLDSHPSADMNTLAIMGFSENDCWQFIQLIGQSTCAAFEHQCADDNDIAVVESAVEVLLDRESKRKTDRIIELEAELKELKSKS